MATLRELFAKLYAYVLLFEQADFRDAGQPSFEQVRGKIASLLEQQGSVAKRQRLDKEYQEALFAFVAWADEMILKQSTWEARNQWRASQLQLEHFHTRNAGEELFDKLSELSEAQKEVREIYYLSLGLGFSGRYFLEEDANRLAQIRHAQVQHLPLPVEEVSHIDKLTPQPYQVASPPRQDPPWPWEKVLLRVALMLLVAVPLGLFIRYKFTAPPPPHAKLSVPPSASTLPSPAAPLRPTRALLEKRLADLSCAKVVVLAFDEKTGLVRLGGRVASDPQRAEINQMVRGVEGVKQVHDDTVQIMPRPFCEVLELLEPLKEHAEANAFSVSIRLNRAGDMPVYHRGDNLVVDVQSPPTFKSYLYVDYYAADGGVGHLLPNPQEPPQLFNPASPYTVGRIGGPRQLEILPPFGRELVTVIASKTPLFQPQRLQPEPAESYLPVMRQALQGVAPSDVAATFGFITTRDR